jgi:hypothetical protein
MSHAMLELAMVTLLLVPNLVLAATSKAGSHAGHYVIAGWLVLSVVAGVWSIAFFVYGAAVLGGAAALFRERLRIGAFFAQHTKAR